MILVKVRYITHAGPRQTLFVLNITRASRRRVRCTWSPIAHYTNFLGLYLGWHGLPSHSLIAQSRDTLVSYMQTECKCMQLSDANSSVQKYSGKHPHPFTSWVLHSSDTKGGELSWKTQVLRDNFSVQCIMRILRILSYQILKTSSMRDYRTTKY